MLMFASKNAAIVCEEDTDSVLLAAFRPGAAVTGRVSGSKDWVQPNRSMDITTLCAQPSSPLPSTSCCVQQSLSKTSLLAGSVSPPGFAWTGPSTEKKALLTWCEDLATNIQEQSSLAVLHALILPP